MKVMTLAKTFPAYHPKAKQPTNFVAAFRNGEKIHTIRQGKGYKVGEVRSLRQWSAKPYHSPQETVCAVVITEVHDITISPKGSNNEPPMVIVISHHGHETIGELEPGNPKLMDLAKSDGLSVEDFIAWFMPYVKSKPFDGQLIYFMEIPTPL